MEGKKITNARPSVSGLVAEELRENNDAEGDPNGDHDVDK